MQNYLELPKLESWRMLYHSGYWDGPLSGMILFEMERHWFELCDDMLDHSEEPEFAPWFSDDCPEGFEVPWTRRYLVYRLTPEQLSSVDSMHADFNALVGFHCDYIKHDGGRERYVCRDQSHVDRFYEKRRSGAYPKLDLKLSTPIGWIER